MTHPGDLPGLAIDMPLTVTSPPDASGGDQCRRRHVERVQAADQRRTGRGPGRPASRTRSRTSCSPTTRCGPAQLRRWYPGRRVALADAPERAGWRFTGLPPAAAGPGSPTGGPRSRWTCAAFRPARGSQTRPSPAGCWRPPPRRPGQFGCFGLHEWAMVYRQDDTAAPAPGSGRCGWAGRHRRGGARAPDQLHPLRRLPVLHPAGPAAQHRAAGPGRPGSDWSSRAACTPSMDSTSGPTS